MVSGLGMSMTLRTVLMSLSVVIIDVRDEESTIAGFWCLEMKLQDYWFAARG
jgi:hypothetical protein